MFSTILSEVTKNIEKRFLMNVFFPTLLFLSSLLCLALINDMSDAIKAWNDQSIEIQIVMIIAFLFIVTFFAYIFDGHLTHILRLYEGYYWEDIPIIGKLLSQRILRPKKRQHQIILQVADLQATRIDYELKRLSLEKDAIGFDKGIDNCNFPPTFDKRKAKENLNKAIDKLGSAKSELDNDNTKLNEAKKKLQSCFSPDLNTAENIGGIPHHLNNVYHGFMKEALDLLNDTKKMIILSDPEKSIKVAEKANEKLTLSEKAIGDLMKDLANVGPTSNNLQKRLLIKKDEMQSLIKEVEKFTEEGEYGHVKRVESDSKKISPRLNSLETDLKAIGSDLISSKSIPPTALKHYVSALENLRGAKKEWDKLDISKILADSQKFPEDDERLSEIKKEIEKAENEANRIYKRIYFHYPIDKPQAVMPTILGNVLKSAEMYSKERYNAEAVFFWSKLYPVMSSEWITALANARGLLDLMILISFLSFLLSAVGGVILLLIGAQPLQFVLVFWVFLFLGWVAYKGAITYAVTYSDMIRSTFDLYRDKLISELGLKLPESIDAEKKFWDDLGQWLYRNRPPGKTIQYSKSSKEAS